MPDKIVNHFVLADGSTAKYDAGSLLNLDGTVSLAGYAPDAKAVGDEITDLKSAIANIGTNAIMPPRTGEDSFYTSHSDNGFYICNRTIAKGEIITSIRIRANSSKTGTIYIIDASTSVVLKTIEATVVSGWNNFEVDYVAETDVLVGFCKCYIDFRSGTAVTDDDMLFNSGAGLYEATPKTAVVGDMLTITQSSSGRYAFAVQIFVLKSGYIKDIINASENNYKLNNGNLLRYKDITGQIGYVGRWWDYNDKPCTNTDGAELFFKVNGTTTAILTLGQINAQEVTPYMAISIDGNDFTRQQIDNATITLPDTGEHIVRVMIDGMTEKNQYQSDKWEKRVGIYVISLTVDDNATITGIVPTNRLGMFFGDSVTEGINALGTGANSNVNSASHSFPYYCAKELNATPYFVGYGGTGVTVPYSFHPFGDAIDWNAYKIAVGEVTPDFIVVNHGINDDGASVAGATYIETYKADIERLRVKYSSTPIFCVVPFRASQPYAAEIESMCAEYSNTYFISSDGWGGETTDGTHLSALGAENNGKLLAKELLRVLGKSFFII